MPIPVEALAQMLSGGGMTPIDQQFKGTLTDQRGQVKPPMLLRDQPEFTAQYEKEMDPNWFPLLPAGDVMDFPKRNYHRPVGPTPMSSDYMLGRKADPGIAPINSDRKFWEDWVNRLQNRQRIEAMGGLRG